MKTYAINIEFIVEAKSQEKAEAISQEIIEAVKLEDLIERAAVQDIELLEDEDDAPDEDYDE